MIDGSNEMSQHQPGKLVGNDAVPEFQAQTLPPGSAPASKTFQPNPDTDVPSATSDHGTHAALPDEQPSAADTIGGATSADVHGGLGHPGQGQTSTEIRHDGGEKKGGQGLQGVGASGTKEFKTANEHDPEMAHLRALDKDEAVGGRGDKPSAQDRIPETADTVASEYAPKERGPTKTN